MQEMVKKICEIRILIYRLVLEIKNKILIFITSQILILSKKYF